MEDFKNYIFDKKDRRYWIKSVNSICKQIKQNNGKTKEVGIVLRNIGVKEFNAPHIVLLACLILHIENKNYSVVLEADQVELENYIFEEIQMQQFINNDDVVYVDKDKNSNLSLWKIINKRSKEYTITLTNYFQKTYFAGLDLSGFQNALDEMYANVADHSESNGIAFSFIEYDEKERKIHFAICDLGLGIPATLRAALKSIKNDKEALEESLKVGVSAKTHKHNMGFGMDNVLSNLSDGGMIRIVSNEALLFCQEDKKNIKSYMMNFDFKGTLIYFDLSIDSFEKEENFLEDEIFKF